MPEVINDREWSQVQPIVPRPDPVRPTTDVQNLSVEFIKLRDYFEMRLSSIDEKGIMRVESLAKELAVAMRANSIAIDKAESAIDKRLISMNEFRQTLTDQTATFATRASIETLKVTIDERNNVLQASIQSELRSLRLEMQAEITGIRKAAEVESKSMWRIITGLAVSIAVIETIIKFGF